MYLRLDHPNICRLLFAYEGKNDVWLVMELCGPELYSRLCQKKSYSEAVAAEVLLQMLQAVNYLHLHNIVHRDLKLENWMYAVGDSERLKLIDFGFSRVVSGSDETLEMPCGTLHYTPPEVLQRRYTSKCDLWSLGVITYMLLLGRPPFRGENNRRIAAAIVRGEFSREAPWRRLSSEAQDFVEQLLTKDPSRRPDAQRALEHPWLSAPARRVEDLGAVLGSLRRFAHGSHLRRAALTVLAYSLTSRELQDLEATFLALDREGRGTITLASLSGVLREGGRDTAELQRLLQSLDCDDEEVAYTPFVAAMLATRVRQHEDRVRAAFEAFDREKRGYLTAESLQGLQVSGQAVTKEEAERWIREVDYRGNGVLDYEAFLSALQGRPLWADSEEAPAVRVFDGVSEAGAPRARGQSDSDLLAAEPRAGADLRHGLAAAIIDEDPYDSVCSERLAQSFQESSRTLHIRSMSCAVDDNYFA